MTRWETLFADLEGQFAGEAEAERRLEVADRSRAELARLRLIDRIRPLRSGPDEIHAAVIGLQPVVGRVLALGPDWLLLRAGGADVLVALAAISWVRGLGQRSAEPGWEGEVGSRLRLTVVLRRMLRDRGSVAVGLTSGETLVGTLGRVGADHVDLEERAGDRVAGRQWTVPLSAIATIRRRG